MNFGFSRMFRACSWDKST